MFIYIKNKIINIDNLERTDYFQIYCLGTKDKYLRLYYKDDNYTDIKIESEEEYNELLKEIYEQIKPVKVRTYEEGFIAGFSHNIKTVEELEKRIKKAIQYLEKNALEPIFLDCKMYETSAYNDLLEILKGEQKK